MNESLNRAEQLRAQQLSLNRALRRLIKNDRYREMGALLVTAPRIGMITAINILTEIHPIGRFEKFDDLNSFVGLCPTEHSTGDKEKKGKITPRKQKSLREYLIEAAWVAIRTDPALLKCYTEYQKRMSKKRAIIRIARKNTNPVAALFSGFPAGTVTGAPKIRAMEIIDELEPERRSFYGGCVGYFDGNGNVDTCITLRTGLVKDNTLYVQAGAGVESPTVTHRASIWKP